MTLDCAAQSDAHLSLLEQPESDGYADAVDPVGSQQREVGLLDERVAMVEHRRAKAAGVVLRVRRVVPVQFVSSPSELALPVWPITASKAATTSDSNITLSVRCLFLCVYCSYRTFTAQVRINYHVKLPKGSHQTP